jgi:arabinose-5-phosphate isomerase
LAVAKQTILSESESITKLIDLLDENFADAAGNLSFERQISSNRHRKSAIIAQKMVATFNSTGTPSLFLHASEAIHGDLGMVQKDDIICISKAETVLK